MTGGPGFVPLRLGTRGSALALAQASRVADLLAERAGRAANPVVIRTEGDVDKTSPLTVIGGRGVFTSALGDALLAGRIDAAVHSAKDLPSQGTPGLALVAFPEREDARDVLVSRHGLPLADLPPRPVIGTSSRRRAVQVLLARPDARIVELRGNVDSRLKKALSPATGDGALDAVVLAAAGVRRMGWQDRVTAYLPIDRFVPSPGQGALAIETREDDRGLSLWAAIDDPTVARAVRVERAFLRAIGGGCTSPVGAHVDAIGSGLRLRAMLATEDGMRVEWADERLDIHAPEDQAAAIAHSLLAALGARRVAVRTLPRNEPATRRPSLAGAAVLVTRAAEQAPPLLAALRERGAEPLALPTIRIEPTAHPAPLDAALRRLASMGTDADWVVFASANAVEQVLARLDRLGLGAAVLRRVSVAAVGPATAAALGAAGVTGALVPARPDAAGTVAALAERGVAGRWVLVPPWRFGARDAAGRLAGARRPRRGGRGVSDAAGASGGARSRRAAARFAGGGRRRDLFLALQRPESGGAAGWHAGVAPGGGGRLHRWHDGGSGGGPWLAGRRCRQRDYRRRRGRRRRGGLAARQAEQGGDDGCPRLRGPTAPGTAGRFGDGSGCRGRRGGRRGGGMIEGFEEAGGRAGGATAVPPFKRLRRLRRSEAVRRLVRETTLAAADFIYPLFVSHGAGVRREIGSMPGQFQLSVDELPRELAELAELGIGAVLLFGLPAEKDAVASGAYDPDGVVQEAVRLIKREAPDLLVVTDVCACEYTDHGHCGLLTGCEVDNDRTLGLLAAIAVSHAAAGGRRRRPIRHDGRPGGGDSERARRGRARFAADHVLRRQVRLRLLRPVPGGGG
jgi:hydroxymethylbilane synthase